MISVIMPVFNAEKYIKEAIESVLGQSEMDWELILIDDCGTDKSIDIASSIKDGRIKIIHNDINRGIAYSTNRGIEEAKGEYIALLDDDDIATKDRLKIEREFLEANPSIDIVGAKQNRIDGDGRLINRPPDYIITNPNRIRAELLFATALSNGTAMIRRDFIEKNNLKYKEGFLGMQDYKFWTEASICGKLTNIDYVLQYRRFHGNSASDRSMTEHTETRKKKFAQIQTEAFVINGFDLTEEEMSVICNEFPEKQKIYSSREDMQDLLYVFRKLIEQGKHMVFSNELEFVLKEKYSKRVSKSYIWE